MKLFNLLAIVMALNACGKNHHSPKQDDTGPVTIKIMTYNIRHGDPSGGDDINLGNIAAVINAQKPDLVALQEVDVNTRRAPVNEVDVLAKATGMHGYFSKSFDFQGGEFGNAILSRYPLQDSTRTLLPNPDVSGNIQSAGIVTVEITPGSIIQFAATHFDLIQENRVAQAKKLVSLSKNSSLPLIIAGDLNATPDAKEISILEGEYIPGCTLGCPPTFPAKKPAKTIDYIMLNPRAAKIFHIVSYNVVPHVQASDHLPLLEYLTKQ